MKKVMMVFGISMLLSASAFADFQGMLNWFQGPRKDIRSIIITSNYVKSRMLADLIQAESRQPYVLLPAETEKNRKIFFCPVNKKHPAFELTENNVARFINFANPQKVYVVGGTQYVPQRYLDQIDPKIQIIIVPVKDWEAAARSLGDMMNLPNLSADFNVLNHQVDRGLYVPGKATNNTAEPDQVEIEDTDTTGYETPAAPVVIDNSPVTKRVVPVEEEPASTQPVVTPKTEVKADAVKVEDKKADAIKPVVKAEAPKAEAKPEVKDEKNTTTLSYYVHEEGFKPEAKVEKKADAAKPADKKPVDDDKDEDK